MPSVGRSRIAKAGAVTLLTALSFGTGLTTVAAEAPANPTKGIPAALPEPGADAALEEKMAWCRFEVERRVIKLDLLDAEVARSASLSSSHRAGVVEVLTGTRSGVLALDAAIAAETDRGRLDKLCRQLETQHLVFSLRTPQVQNIIGADTVVTLSRSLRGVSDDLGPRIDAAEAIGNPYVARMRELNAAVVTLTDDARVLVDGIADALGRLTPPDWLANRQVLIPFQQKNREARAGLVLAREHIEEIRRLLEWQPEPPSTTTAAPTTTTQPTTSTTAAPVVASGQVSGVWSPSVRFKSFGNTGSQELYVGFGDLGRAENRSGMDMVYAKPSTNRFTFSYDPAQRSVRTDVDLRADGHADGNASFTAASLRCTALDRLQVLVAANHPGVTVNLRNLVVNGTPLGDFTGVSGSSTWWNYVGQDLSGGFTITGEVEISGTFSGGDERSKVEIQAGCAPS
jgi:hypothetical protein